MNAEILILLSSGAQLTIDNDNSTFSDGGEVWQAIRSHTPIEVSGCDLGAVWYPNPAHVLAVVERER